LYFAIFTDITSFFDTAAIFADSSRFDFFDSYFLPPDTPDYRLRGRQIFSPRHISFAADFRHWLFFSDIAAAFAASLYFFSPLAAAAISCRYAFD